MRHFLLCLFPLAFIFSCKKNNGRATQSINDTSLIGTWNWVAKTQAIAIYGPPYDTLTPQNTGLTKTLTMNSDSSWQLVQNGIVVDGGRFRVLQVITPAKPILALDVIGRSGRDSTINHSIAHDSLYTSSQLYTGTYAVDVYVRQK
jgi:hypothetical protein